MKNLINQVDPRRKHLSLHGGAIVGDYLWFLTRLLGDRFLELAGQHCARIEAKIWRRDFYSNKIISLVRQSVFCKKKCSLRRFILFGDEPIDSL